MRFWSPIPLGGMSTLTVAPVSFAAASAPALASTQKKATPLVTKAIFGGSLGEAFIASIAFFCRAIRASRLWANAGLATAKSADAKAIDRKACRMRWLLRGRTRPSPRPRLTRRSCRR